MIMFKIERLRRVGGTHSYFRLETVLVDVRKFVYSIVGSFNGKDAVTVFIFQLASCRIQPNTLRTLVNRLRRYR